MSRTGLRIRVTAAACAAAVCALGLAGCREPGMNAALATLQAPVHATLKPTPLAYFGTYEPQSPASYSGVQKFGQLVGRTPNLALYFSGWGEAFPGAFARQAWQHGTMPLVAMDPVNISFKKIAAGLDDSYLQDFALQVRSFGHPVVITFAHEMNGSWYSWGYHRMAPELYVVAWQHVVTLFRQEGADNVTWLWAVNRLDFGEGPIRDWWPGSQYVTWVGIDGYYVVPTDTFATVFGPTIRALRKLTSKPVLIAETGIGPLAGQVAKLPGLMAGVRSHHLLGLVWFDKSQHNGLHHQDWRIEGLPAVIAAFRHALKSLR